MMGARAAFWWLAGATLAVYLAMVLWSLPQIADAAAGLRPFDLRPFGYGGPEARAFLAALSPEGTAFYLGVQHKLDIVYPPALAITLVWAFLRLLPRGWALIAAIPALLGAVFDLFENAAVAGLLRAGADGASDAMVAVASQWTVLKSASDAVALIALLLALGMRRRARRARR